MDGNLLASFLTSSQEDDLNALMVCEGIHDVAAQLDDYTVSSSEQGQDTKPFAMELGLTCSDPPHQPPAPYNWPVPATMKLPSTERYEGESGFTINLLGPNEGKSWIFSIPLNKVFINVGNKFPVQFIWKSGSVSEPRVRAVMMFLSPDSLEESVERCNHHALRTDKTNINFPHDVRHIVRTDHASAEYWTDPTSERRSVVISLEQPQAGTYGTTVLYSFVCKNSCPSGMNRRATQIVFTLEDVYGQVYGREAMNIRICSCPKRDKDKEEADILKTSVSKDKKMSVKRRKPADDVDSKRQRNDDASVTIPEEDRDIASAMAVAACVMLKGRARKENRPMTAEETSKFNSYNELV